MTGQTQAKNFFSGSIANQVDQKLNTWDKTRPGNISNSAAKMEKLRGQRPADTVSKASKASSVKGRYSTKADALSTGFQEIA